MTFDWLSDGPPRRAAWFAVATWVLVWALLLGLDTHTDLANKALVLVLGASVAALWSARWASLTASTAAVLAFDYAFVPPRGTFRVDLHHHALLLATMLTVSWIVTLLMARLQWHAAQGAAHAVRSDQRSQLGETLRAADDAVLQATALQQMLAALNGAAVTVCWLEGPSGAPQFLGPASPDEVAGLRLCLQGGGAMGPGTGRHEEQPSWYLPLRGVQGTPGAAIVRLPEGGPPAGGLLEHMQSLCDQLGAALERTRALQAAAAAREQAHAQALRNTLLAAISHDHRTPLATILGAASSLHDQAERLSPAQRRQLAATIVDETTQLVRLTDNTLQLARLGTPGVRPTRDWESVEELVGTVLRRVRQRNPALHVKARVEPGLPLLRCDAVLIVQLLDNLVDNALKHGGSAAPVEVLARQLDDRIVIAVRDRGPGIPASQHERVFETFERGQRVVPRDGDGGSARPGAGVGLALCRAIAQGHGGELRLRQRSHGGASFELVLPVEPMPGPTPRDVAAGAST